MNIIVKCPECKKDQKTNPKDVKNAVKKCVYCNRSFKVWSLDPQKNNIVRRE